MINLRTEVCQQVREARKAAKIGQTELALEVGCKQSALSMFESGQPTKLNDEVVGRLLKKFNIKIDDVAAKEASAPRTIVSPSLPVSPEIKGFCPNPKCPSNRAYAVEDRTFLLPDRSAADPVGGRYCAMCGEVLERKCPNCGAPVHAGAVCSRCGDPYITL